MQLVKLQSLHQHFHVSWKKFTWLDSKMIWSVLPSEYPSHYFKCFYISYQANLDAIYSINALQDIWITHFCKRVFIPAFTFIPILSNSATSEENFYTFPVIFLLIHYLYRSGSIFPVCVEILSRRDIEINQVSPNHLTGCQDVCGGTSSCSA